MKRYLFDREEKIIHFDDLTILDGKKEIENEVLETMSENELLYFSDFVLGLENMSAKIELRLPENVPESTRYISITAIDSWGEESESVLYKVK